MLKEGTAMRIRMTAMALFVGALTASAATDMSEVTVELKLDASDYVMGERIRGVVNVVNLSPQVLQVGTAAANADFRIEVARSRDGDALEPFAVRPFVADFNLEPNEGQKLETYLADHYRLNEPGRYTARPVLVFDGIRYEGQIRAFDVVPGMRICGALQMFVNHPDLRREFELVYWNRAGSDHLFLKASDTDAQGEALNRWMTVDLGTLMKITKPTVSIMRGGEVVVLHRVDPDNFIRSEFWSVGDGIEFHRRELLQDPETAGSSRVRELYRESGGVKPAERPWWKFW